MSDEAAKKGGKPKRAFRHGPGSGGPVHPRRGPSPKNGHDEYSLGVRLDLVLEKALRARARTEGRNISAQVRWMLRQALGLPPEEASVGA